MSSLTTANLQQNTQQQNVNISLEALNRIDNRQSESSVSHEQIDEAYTGLIKRLLVIGGASSSASVAFALAGITKAIDPGIAFNSAWTCFGFALGCITVRKTSKIFLKKIKEMHDLLNSVRNVTEETRNIIVNQQQSSLRRSTSLPDEQSLIPFSGSREPGVGS